MDLFGPSSPPPPPDWNNLAQLGQPEAVVRNAPYVKGGVGAANYATALSPIDELAFRSWVQKNAVPFNPDAKTPQDYDMRGFYQALQSKDPRAQSAIDPNDNRLHYPDYWKTPYHETFSNQSQWATPVAPAWTGDDKLVSPGGRILFDDRRGR